MTKLMMMFCLLASGCGSLEKEVTFPEQCIDVVSTVFSPNETFYYARHDFKSVATTDDWSVHVVASMTSNQVNSLDGKQDTRINTLVEFEDTVAVVQCESDNDTVWFGYFY